MLGIIGGSGLADYDGLVIKERRAVSTPFGSPSADLVIGALAATDVVFLARHGNPHSIAPDKVNYRANIKALNDIGVSEIIAVNAVGGISQEQDAMQLSLPDQLIDYTYSRANSFFDGIAAPLQHVDFTYPFDLNLRHRLLHAASSVGVSVLDKACVAAVQGPRLETAAEVKRLANDGCDIVGMTAMPEAALARELNIPYASITLVVNKAAGCTEELIEWQDIERNMHQGIADVKALINAYCSLS